MSGLGLVLAGALAVVPEPALCVREGVVVALEHAAVVEGVSLARVVFAEGGAGDCPGSAALIAVDPAAGRAVLGSPVVPVGHTLRLWARPGGTFGTHLVVAVEEVAGNVRVDTVPAGITRGDGPRRTGRPTPKSGNGAPACTRNAWRPGARVLLEVVGAGGSGDALLARAAASAARTWSALPCADVRLAVTSAPAEAATLDPDGRTAIAFVYEESALFDNLGAEALAFTCAVCDEDGYIVEADVRLDAARHEWSDACDGVSWDAEAIVVHELGHVLGLGHASDTAAVMFPLSTPRRLLAARRLGAADAAVACAEYPCLDVDGCADGSATAPLDCTPGGGLCASCSTDAECGATTDLCVMAGGRDGGCARACSTSFPCPAGFVCVSFGEEVAPQCVPEGERCPAPAARVGCGCVDASDCDPGGLCVSGRCGADCSGGVACPAPSVCSEVIEDGAPSARQCLAPASAPDPCARPDDPPRGCGCAAARTPHARPVIGALLFVLALVTRRWRVAASGIAVAALIAGSPPAVASAQGVELSRADRLAILYTPQLQFSTDGEPLIKIGVAEGVPSITFSADTRVTVLPLGDGGPEVSVPAHTRLRVAIEDGQPGVYEHAIVVADFTRAERAALEPTVTSWEARGYPVTLRHVGAIFAIDGQRFDTRLTLATVAATANLSEAEALAEQLSVAFGIDARVHSELSDYPGGTLVLSGLPGGVTITHRDLLWVRGTEATEFTVEDVPFDRWMGGAQTQTRSYVGSLVFSADRDGALSLVNETTIERLVRGILPSEMYGDAPSMALRAQAVAARSELLADLGVRHLADPYMTCSDQRCQVYRGVSVETARMTAAVDATRGQVLAEGDQVIKAYFSSNNGGFAGSNATTWGEEQRAYLAHHPDGPDPPAELLDGLDDEEELRAFLADPPDSFSDIDRAASTFRWTVTLSGAELSARVAARHPDIGVVRALNVLERGPDGRVARLQIAGTRGEAVVERELNVRMVLGGDRPLKSALIVIDVLRGPDGAIAQVDITGGGFGHGVGLCQSGAVGMADRGYDYTAILENYYPGAQLRTLY